MKAYWVLGMAMAAGLAVDAQGCTVMVYAYAKALSPPGMLLQAERQSATMFREIGIEMQWRTGAVRANAADDACGAPIMIQLENTGRARRISPDALAFATPFAVSGTCIHVLLDRVLTERSKGFTTAILAHVLAHNSRARADGPAFRNWRHESSLG
jgi:hypothetical protein